MMTVVPTTTGCMTQLSVRGVGIVEADGDWVEKIVAGKRAGAVRVHANHIDLRS